MGASFDWETRLALVLGLIVAAGAVGFGVLRTNFGAPMVQPMAPQANTAAAQRGNTASARKTPPGDTKPSIRRLPKQRVDELRRQRRIELMRERANEPGPTPLPLRRPETQRPADTAR